MSNKDTLVYTLTSTGDMSGNVTTAATNIRYMDNVGVQLSWTSTPTGNFFVDLTLDDPAVVTSPTWNPITLSPAPSAAGSAGSYYIDLNQLSAVAVRVRYVASSGSGTLTVKLSAKRV